MVSLLISGERTTLLEFFCFLPFPWNSWETEIILTIILTKLRSVLDLSSSTTSVERTGFLLSLVIGMFPRFKPMPCNHVLQFDICISSNSRTVRCPGRIAETVERYIHVGHFNRIKCCEDDAVTNSPVRVSNAPLTVR